MNQKAPRKIGPFEIVSCIAETEKSDVYLARDPKLHRHVAIKKLKQGLDETRAEQFDMEGRRLAREFAEKSVRLAMVEPHPNVVEVYSAGVDEDNSPYLVMQYIPGQTLEGRLQNGPIDEKEALKIMREVAAGIAHLHKSGIEHHDLKPRNIGLHTRGACILDLGGVVHPERSIYDDITALGSLAKTIERKVSGSNKRISRVSADIGEGKFKTAYEIEKRITWEEKSITRRNAIKYVAAGLVTLATAGAVKTCRDYIESIGHTVEEIKEMDPSKDREKFREECSTLVRKIADKTEQIIKTNTIERKAFPYNIPKGRNIWTPVPANWEWTTGYWPAILWVLGSKTNNPLLLQEAENWTNDVAESHADDASTTNAIRCLHAYGTAFEHTKKTAYADKTLEAAKRISQLSDQERLYLKFKDPRITPERDAIFLDHMELAIPLLTWAYRKTKDPQIKKIIESHGVLTEKILIESDGSTVQCATFDPEEMTRLNPIKMFGYSGKSCLSRSHARAILGFLDIYETFADKRWLAPIDSITNYALSNLPEDGVLWYDFKDPSPDKPKDTAATAMLALALGRKFRITHAEEDLFARDHILHSLITHSLAVEPEYQGLLRNGCANRNKKLEEMALIYGDHAFIKTLCEST